MKEYTVELKVGDAVIIRSLYPDMPDLVGNFRGRQGHGNAIVVSDGIQMEIEWERIAPMPVGEPVEEQPKQPASRYTAESPDTIAMAKATVIKAFELHHQHLFKTPVKIDQEQLEANADWLIKTFPCGGIETDMEAADIIHRFKPKGRTFEKIRFLGAITDAIGMKHRLEAQARNCTTEQLVYQNVATSLGTQGNKTLLFLLAKRVPHSDLIQVAQTHGWETALDVLIKVANISPREPWRRHPEVSEAMAPFMDRLLPPTDRWNVYSNGSGYLKQPIDGKAMVTALWAWTKATAGSEVGWFVQGAPAPERWEASPLALKYILSSAFAAFAQVNRNDIVLRRKTR